MKIRTWIKYEESYLPPRCRKLRYRECEDYININLKEVDSSELKAHNLSQYPNFSATGSIKGMKEQYYGKDALLVRSGSWIYKVPESVYYCAH